MTPWNSPAHHLFLLLPLGVVLLSVSPIHGHSDQTTNGGAGRRLLLSFSETPHGSNHTFKCSPSGACVPCQYSEKSDEKYRCSETGYRIPLKCVEVKDVISDENKKKSPTRRFDMESSDNYESLHGMLRDATSNTHRSLLEDTSNSAGESQAYITYRSCIQQVSEEKLSVIRFEGIIFCLLLVSGSAVYFRKKRTVTMPGVGGGRMQPNSRF